MRRSSVRFRQAAPPLTSENAGQSSFSPPFVCRGHRRDRRCTDPGRLQPGRAVLAARQPGADRQGPGDREAATRPGKGRRCGPDHVRRHRVGAAPGRVTERSVDRLLQEHLGERDPGRGGAPVPAPSFGTSGESISWAKSNLLLVARRTESGSALQQVPVNDGRPYVNAQLFDPPAGEMVESAVWQGPRITIRPTAAAVGPNLSVPSTPPCRVSGSRDRRST
jgi:hypothetical protein